ncbi:MAG: 6-phosphogluconolactonase [Xanthobacteraceae bacterium]|nr:6-phosphogluconolactonase [Xanthobacteraceae bacterium]
MNSRPPEYRIHDDAEAMARAVAEAFIEIIEQSASERLAVCLTGGSTPTRVYQLLMQRSLPSSRLHWFWSDERFVPPTDPRSNARMVLVALLNHVDRADRIHNIRCEPGSLARSAELYEAELQRFYGDAALDPARPLFDLVLLGMGEDGHIASLFPGSPLLRERVRWVAAVEHAAQAPFVPRITLTLPPLQSAKEVIFLVAGSHKRKAMDKVLAGDDIPATMLRPSGRTRWFVDRAAMPEGKW